MIHIVRVEISKEGQVGTLILDLGQGEAQKGLEMVSVLATGHSVRKQVNFWTFALFRRPGRPQCNGLSSFKNSWASKWLIGNKNARKDDCSRAETLGRGTSR